MNTRLIRLHSKNLAQVIPTNQPTKRANKQGHVSVLQWEKTMKCLLTYKYIKFWQKLRNIKSEYRNIQSFYNTYTELISLTHSKRLWTHNNSINLIVTKGRVSAGDGQAVRSSLPTWTNAKNSQLWARAVLVTAAISCCLSPSSKKWGRFWRKGSCLWVWGPMSAVPALKRRQETVSSSISAYTYSDTLSEHKTTATKLEELLLTVWAGVPLTEHNRAISMKVKSAHSVSLTLERNL